MSLLTRFVAASLDLYGGECPFDIACDMVCDSEEELDRCVAEYRRQGANAERTNRDFVLRVTVAPPS